MKKRYIAGIVIVVLALCAVVAGIFINSSTNAPGNKVNDPQVTLEGQVVRIIHPEGACLTYQIDENTYVSVECPGMEGYQGFTGDYDKDIKVGDKVVVRGNPRSTESSDHQTYHLAKPGTYMRLAE